MNERRFVHDPTVTVENHNDQLLLDLVERNVFEVEDALGVKFGCDDAFALGMKLYDTIREYVKFSAVENKAEYYGYSCEVDERGCIVFKKENSTMTLNLKSDTYSAQELLEKCTEYFKDKLFENNESFETLEDKVSDFLIECYECIRI